MITPNMGSAWGLLHRVGAVYLALLVFLYGFMTCLFACLCSFLVLPVFSLFYSVALPKILFSYIYLLFPMTVDASVIVQIVISFFSFSFPFI